MNLTDAFLWIMLPLLAIALFRILYLWGRTDGETRERIRLTGSSLPRYENPPPPPPKYRYNIPLPDVSDIHLNEEEKDGLNEVEQKLALALKRQLATDKRVREKQWLKVPSITQDQLIDALMDMRIENFLAAHTIPAHAGTDLYYFSRKETAEYLLDMYHITPKAKH